MARRQAQVIIVVAGKDEASAIFQQVAANLGQMTEKSKSSFGILDGVMMRIGAKMTDFAQQLPRMAVEFVKLGAQAEAVTHRFTQFAGGAERADAMLAAFQAGTEGAASKMESMAAASRLLQMGLVDDAETMQLVAAMATKLGDQTVSATERLSGFALMLANQSIPRLDNYGISSGKVRARIEELQKAIAGLSREEAFKMAVMEEGSKALGILGDTSELTVTSIQKLEARFADLRTELAERVAPAAGVVVGALLDIMDASTTAREAARKAHENEVAAAARASQTYEEYLKNAERTRVGMSRVAGEAGNLTQKTDVLTEAEWRAARAASMAAASDVELQTHAKDLGITVEDTTEKVKKFNLTLAANADPAGDMMYQSTELARVLDEMAANSEKARAALEAQAEGQRKLTELQRAMTEEDVLARQASSADRFALALEGMREKSTMAREAMVAQVENQREAEEQARRLAEEAERVASAIGDTFVAAVGPAIEGAEDWQIALFEAADAAGADAEELALLGGALGIFTEEQIRAALAMAALKAKMEELGEAIAAGTMTMNEAIAAAKGASDAFREEAGALADTTLGSRAAAGASRDAAAADREAARAAAELARAEAHKGDVFMDMVRKMGIAAHSVDGWSAALFRAADAEGASHKELAALGVALGIYTDEQAEAALKAAALQSKIEQLGRKIAEGMGIPEAMARLGEYRTRYLGVTAAQGGFSGWVGPGHGGSRLILAGEGMTPEHVSVSKSYNMGGNVYNVTDPGVWAAIQQQERWQRRQAAVWS